jgi:hypothetical protein
MGFVKFMAGPVGRGLRIAAGLALVLIGAFYVGHAGGVVLAVVGVAPLLAGLFNVCLFAPLFGGPFNGRQALGHS